MADFHRQIIDWYRQNKRSLPWRNTQNPYKIWLSEVILQQTRITQGLAYYNTFVKHYPTVTDLANAKEEDVLNDWQGLGYYSRARNLHFAAKQIIELHSGIFPSEYNEIRKLKGIGDYTAAAIASFAFKKKHAVIDGNVYRVLSRVFDIDTPIDSTVGKKLFFDLANQLIPEKESDTYNQGIMEFGALHCTPFSPKCENCPITDCRSFTENTILNRPVKSKKIKVRTRYFHFAVFNNENKTIIEKRIDKDIWQHLYQFPLFESDSKLSTIEIDQHFFKLFGLNFKTYSETYTHLLSHQKLIATFYEFDSFPSQTPSGGITILKEEIQDYPLPRLIDKYWESK